MNKFKIILLTITILTITNSLFSIDLSRKQLFLQKSIFSLLDRYHYVDLKIDDDFSGKAFDLYLERLDFYKRYFYQNDIDIFNKYRNKLDDQILNNSFEFYIMSNDILDKRIKETKLMVNSLLEGDFTLDKKDTLETDENKLKFPENYKEKKAYWEKILRWDITNRYLDLIEEEQSKGIKDEDKKDNISYKYLFDGKVDPKILKEAIEKIKKKYDGIFIELEEMSQDDKLALYFNSMLNIYDPHTVWMPPLNKEDFDFDMTGKLEGIGATLSKDKEYTKITSIIPGSPSWKQGELEPDDIILKVAQGDKDPVDISEMPVRKVVKLVRGKKGTEVRLTIKKPSGEILIIPIIRDIVIVEESYAKASIIENEKSQKFGYIRLPKFYRDFKNENARNSTNDVKEAIIEMNSKNISGLILDLRNNGGGALADAVDLSGLFFDKGPVVQVRKPDNNINVLYDKDNKTFFDKPLIILVNSLSASASEILAAALQDYNRAVIIGSNQTFGKGTVQSLFPLNRILSLYGSEDEFGSIKFTIQKFYRINGESTQFKGVVPNVIVPDSYDYRDFGEKEYDYALPWDTIKTADYNLWSKLPIANDNELIKISKRIEKDDRFKEINETNKRLREKIELKEINLNINDIINERKEARVYGINSRKKFKENKNLIIHEVNYHPSDIKLTEEDIQIKKEKDEKWEKGLRQDIYVNEAINVINDLNNK